MWQFKQQQVCSAFRVWYFCDSHNFNYAILTPVDLLHWYGISGRESEMSLHFAHSSGIERKAAIFAGYL